MTMLQGEQATAIGYPTMDVASFQLTHTGNTIGWIAAYDAQGERLFAEGPVRFQEAAQKWTQLKQAYPNAEAHALPTDR